MNVAGNRRPVILPDPGEIEPKQDHFSAVHEAAHAIAAILLDQGLELVAVGKGRFTDGTAIGGYYDFSKVTYTAVVGRGDLAIPSIIMCLAGPIAEFRINKVRLDPNQTQDYIQALDLANLAAGTDEDLGQGRHRVTTRRADQLALYERGRIAAEAFVEGRWALIEALATELQIRRSMAGPEVAAFIEDRERSAA